MGALRHRNDLGEVDARDAGDHRQLPRGGLDRGLHQPAMLVGRQGQVLSGAARADHVPTPGPHSAIDHVGDIFRKRPQIEAQVLVEGNHDQCRRP